MLRRDPSPRPASIPDRELGVAAALLILALVLTTLVVPGLA